MPMLSSLRSLSLYSSIPILLLLGSLDHCAITPSTALTLLRTYILVRHISRLDLRISIVSCVSVTSPTLVLKKYIFSSSTFISSKLKSPDCFKHLGTRIVRSKQSAFRLRPSQFTIYEQVVASPTKSQWTLPPLQHRIFHIMSFAKTISRNFCLSTFSLTRIASGNLVWEPCDKI